MRVASSTVIVSPSLIPTTRPAMVCAITESESAIAIMPARRRAMESETFGSLKGYMTWADQLVASATKDDLAECARILALNVAHYADRYGELPRGTSRLPERGKLER